MMSVLGGRKLHTLFLSSCLAAMMINPVFSEEAVITDEYVAKDDTGKFEFKLKKLNNEPCIQDRCFYSVSINSEIVKFARLRANSAVVIQTSENIIHFTVFVRTSDQKKSTGQVDYFALAMEKESNLESCQMYEFPELQRLKRAQIEMSFSFISNKSVGCVSIKTEYQRKIP